MGGGVSPLGGGAVGDMTLTEYPLGGSDVLVEHDTVASGLLLLVDNRR